MSLGFYIFSGVCAVCGGGALVSEGFFSRTNVGLIIILIAFIIPLGLVAWAILDDSWLAGLIEVVNIVVGIILGKRISQSVNSW